MDDDPPNAGVSRGAGLDIRVSSVVGRLPLARQRIATIAEQVLQGEGCRAAMLNVTFVGARAIARLHREHLQLDGATDILTFQHAPPGRGAPLVGDVYIAPAVARAHARDARCSWREELARLTIHGVLHALGWEHPEGPGRTRSAMWRRQERWLARLRQDGAW